MMSCINMILKPRSAYIIIDGAFVNTRNNKIFGVGSKVIHLPHIPAVIAVRGSAAMFVLVAAVAATISATNFADLKSELIEKLRCNWQFRLLDFMERGTDIGVAGWCDKSGPSSFFFSTSKLHPTKPWTLVDPGDCFICPDTEQMFEKDFSDRSFANMPTDALRLLQCQRQLRVPGKSEDLCLVGGFAALITIHEHSIHTDVIGTWPDKIGDVIKRDIEPVANAQGAIVHRWIA